MFRPTLSSDIIPIAARVLTIVSLTLLVVFSCIPDPNPQQIDLCKTCSTTWKMGFGAIIGSLTRRIKKMERNRSIFPLIAQNDIYKMNHTPAHRLQVGSQIYNK